ncbi:MAG TPA: SAM-dependent methyltransferase [Gemmatimonadaceae bacterium]|nr:SAM-dependent methyltransferase [Gemmatimonadaceae bacterium]
MPIEHISDTARWVAFYRAMETERPDAIFHDPFARRLAGERGEEIVNTMKQGRSNAWALIVRTALFDEIIMDVIGRGDVDLVVNLAAGLDARAWRLALPPALRWVDVDLPDMLAYKTDMMRGETPVCAYEAVAADLTDAGVRRATLARVSSGSRRALVVTEGLLIYLTSEQVASLAAALHAVPAFESWLFDLCSPPLLKLMRRSWGAATERGNAPFQFAPAEGTDFFRPFGWQEEQFRSTGDEAYRLGREMRMAWFWRPVARLMPERKREEYRRYAASVLLRRT